MTRAAKKNKVSQQTIYTWREHLNGPQPSHMKRLKALDSENAKLRRARNQRIPSG